MAALLTSLSVSLRITSLLHKQGFVESLLVHTVHLLKVLIIGMNAFGVECLVVIFILLYLYLSKVSSVALYATYLVHSFSLRLYVMASLVSSV